MPFYCHMKLWPWPVGYLDNDIDGEKKLNIGKLIQYWLTKTPLNSQTIEFTDALLSSNSFINILNPHLNH